MCAIVGIVYKDRDRMVDEPVLMEMRDLLIHRGPDDAGLYIDGHVGLGHRRLSIIDISSGHQPMTNEDETLWIVFNGEIYNFKSLREFLLGKGHRFTTKSDTEVILHLYEEKGADCVKELNGIFAFAIWDTKQKSLFLARDHMGVKPLYYAETDDAFLFASEIKSIAKSGYLEPRCRDEGVFEYFMFRHVSGEHTLFEGVKNLLPACMMYFRDGRIEAKRYWSPYPEGKKEGSDFKSSSEDLSALLEDAVRMQLISDVPLGTFCSGGLDSSLVTAYAAKLTARQINTFSVGFHEGDYDETRYAQMVSKQHGTRHHEIKLDNREFADLLPKMIWHNDEPLNFANSVQIYAVSKLAKEYVTVVLTGEGSDELFAGYPRYFIPRLSAFYGNLPLFLKSIARAFARGTNDHRLKKIHKYSSYSLEEALLYNSSFLDRNFLAEILNNGYISGLEFRESCLREGKERGLDDVTTMALLDQQNYMVSILNRQDKMSMAASIESRVPFLDYRVVEYANSLPARYKNGQFRTKYILKEIAGDFLPAAIVNRRKSGFGVPLGEWLNDSGGVGRYLCGLHDDADLTRYVKKAILKAVIDEHIAGRQDHSEFLWAAINFTLWVKNCVN
jgi:asparagine synthase (glutamine-hydrolysing)